MLKSVNLSLSLFLVFLFFPKRPEHVAYSTAGAGMSGLQSYNSLPVPRSSRVSIDGRRRPMPNLDELLPSGSKDSGSSATQRWNKLHSQLK